MMGLAVQDEEEEEKEEEEGLLHTPQLLERLVVPGSGELREASSL